MNTTLGVSPVSGRHFTGRSITNDPTFQEAIGVSRLDPNDPTEKLMRQMALGYQARAEARRNLTEMSLGQSS